MALSRPDPQSEKPASSRVSHSVPRILKVIIVLHRAWSHGKIKGVIGLISGEFAQKPLIGISEPFLHS